MTHISSKSSFQVYEETVIRKTAMTAGNFPTFDNDGKLIDSGISINQIDELEEVSNTVVIKITDNPQAIFDAHPAGTTFRFEQGEHLHGFNNANNAILYLDKACRIDVPYGAKIKLEDNTTTLQLTAEITNNQGSYKLLDDLSMGATSAYDASLGKVDFYVKIIGTGSPNTFEWGTYSNGVFTIIHGSKNCTTTEQTMSNGVKIKFGQATGHSIDSLWYVSYCGNASYGIRVGTGFNATEIENVFIYGDGEIDMNKDNNIQPSVLVKDVSACALFHGRLRNMNISDLKLYGCERTVMAYGDADGTYLFDGTILNGTETFDITELNVIGIRSLNSGENSRGFLFGHPNHRGSIRKLKVRNNILTGEATLIEPNFNLDGYVITDNILEGVAENNVIHCWRYSENGTINNNIILNCPNFETAFKISAPGGWSVAKNVTFGNGNIFSTGSGNTYAKASNSITALGPLSYVKFDSTNLYTKNGSLAVNGDLVTKANDLGGNKVGVVPASFKLQGTYNSAKNALRLTTTGAVYRFRRTFASPQYISICISAELSDVTSNTVLWSYRSQMTQLIQISVVGGNAALQFRGSGNVLQTITKPVIANTPFKIVVTFNKVANDFKLYVDSIVSPATSSYALAAEGLDATEACIGGYFDGTNFIQAINGSAYVKAEALFNRVLTSGEITTVMTDL